MTLRTNLWCLTVLLSMCTPAIVMAQNVVGPNNKTSTEYLLLAAWGDPGFLDPDIAPNAQPVDSVVSGDLSFNQWPHFASLFGKSVASQTTSGGEHQTGCLYEGQALTGADPDFVGVVYMDADAEQEDTYTVKSDGVVSGELELDFSTINGIEQLQNGFVIHAYASVDGVGQAVATLKWSSAQGDWWGESVDPYNGYQSGWAGGEQISGFSLPWSAPAEAGDIVELGAEISGVWAAQSNGTPTISGVNVSAFSNVDAQ